MKKLILFDLDGTLLQTGRCGKTGLDKAIRKLHGKLPQYDLSLLIGNTDSWNFEEVYRQTFGKKPTAAQLKKIKETYLNILPEEIKNSVKEKRYACIKGVESFIKELSAKKGVYLALGTGNYKDAAYIKMEPSKLGKYFKTGGFGEDSKVRSEMLAKGVARAEREFKAKFAPGDVYVIGDTPEDITAAKANGYHSAVVLTGYGDRKKLLRAAAELEMKDFTDISTWLVWLGLDKDPKGAEKGRYIMPASPIEHVFFSRTGIDEEKLKRLRVKKYSDLPSGKLFK